MFSADGFENRFCFRGKFSYRSLSSDILLWLLSHFEVLSNTAHWPKALHYGALVDSNDQTPNFSHYIYFAERHRDVCNGPVRTGIARADGCI
jgi:hypothetical protein